MKQAEESLVERVRCICLALPETWEKVSHGEPTFFVKKKVFAACSMNHHNDGHVAVVIPAAIGIQEMLIKKSPKKFYRPPYVGVRGWVGIELDRVRRQRIGFASARSLASDRAAEVAGCGSEKEAIGVSAQLFFPLSVSPPNRIKTLFRN